VYADETATWGIGVLSSLARKERVHSFFLDLIQVIQHTDCVLCPIPDVQMFEFFAWDIGTVIAEMRWRSYSYPNADIRLLLKRKGCYYLLMQSFVAIRLYEIRISSVFFSTNYDIR